MRDWTGGRQLAGHAEAHGPRHEVLQRGEGFTLTTDQHVAVLAIEVDANTVGHLFGRGLEIDVHRVHNLLHELGDVCGCHRVLGLGAWGLGLGSRFSVLGSRYAFAGFGGGPIIAFVAYC